MKKLYWMTLFGVIFKSTVQASDGNLSSILQQSGESKPLKKQDISKKKESISHYKFTFEEDLKKQDRKVEAYQYENSSRFKFKFTNEAPQNNFMRRSLGNDGFGGSGGGMSGGKGR